MGSTNMVAEYDDYYSDRAPGNILFNGRCRKYPIKFLFLINHASSFGIWKKNKLKGFIKNASSSDAKRLTFFEKKNGQYYSFKQISTTNRIPILSTTKTVGDKFALIMLVPRNTKHNLLKGSDGSDKVFRTRGWSASECINKLAQTINVSPLFAEDLLHEINMGLHVARVGPDALEKVSNALGPGILKYIGQIRPGMQCISGEHCAYLRSHPSTPKSTSRPPSSGPTNQIIFTGETTQQNTRKMSKKQFSKKKTTASEKYITHATEFSKPTSDRSNITELPDKRLLTCDVDYFEEIVCSSTTGKSSTCKMIKLNHI